MTRFELIKELKELKEKIACELDLSATDYAREQAYICIEDAIDYLKENEE